MASSASHKCYPGPVEVLEVLDKLGAELQAPAAIRITACLIWMSWMCAAARNEWLCVQYGAFHSAASVGIRRQQGHGRLRGSSRKTFVAVSLPCPSGRPVPHVYTAPSLVTAAEWAAPAAMAATDLIPWT